MAWLKEAARSAPRQAAGDAIAATCSDFGYPQCLQAPKRAAFMSRAYLAQGPSAWAPPAGSSSPSSLSDSCGALLKIPSFSPPVYIERTRYVGVLAMAAGSGNHTQGGRRARRLPAHQTEQLQRCARKCVRYIAEVEVRHQFLGLKRQ